MKHPLLARAGRLPRRRPLAAALLALGAVAAASGGHAGETSRDLWRDGTARPATGDIRPAPAGGLGGLTRHDDLSSFEAATATMDLQGEDFEGGFGDVATAIDCFQALGSDSNDACFVPGDLVPGFAVRSARGSIFGEGGDSDIVKLGPWITGTPTTVVGAYQPIGATHVSFEPDVVAVAMDVFDVLQGQAVAVTAYAAGDVQIGTLTVSPSGTAQATFLGLTSDTPIDRIELDALADGAAEMIDDLRFGGRAGMLDAGTAALELGATAVGMDAVTPLTLTNTGDLPLTLTSLPALEAPFAWSGGNCTNTTLAPAATCSALIAFAPTHEGRFATTIADDTLLAQPLTIAAQAQVEQVTPVPGHVEFGQVAAGGQSGVQTIRLDNLTAVDARIEALTTSGPFVRSGGSCGQLPLALESGDSCTLEYRFAPAANGDFAGRIRLGLDDGRSLDIGLTGRTGSP